MDVRDAPAPVRRRAAPATAAGVSLVALFLVIYLPDAGHGFISDDFRWIAEGRVASGADLLRVLTTNVGFYRPAVSLAFGADYALWNMNALGYGVTNVMLCLAVAFLLWALARRLRLPPEAAIVAAGVWLFNFHAINMAVLWLSGRTSLLVSIFSLGAAHSLLARRALLAAVLCLLAMLSKEDAVMLPVFFTALHVVERRPLREATALLPAWGALVVFLVLRAYSGAFWPGNAPAFYQFSLSPLVLGRNALEYLDRTATVGTAVAIVLLVATRVRRSQLNADEARVLRFGALWIPVMFVLTLPLPVRSSLYALTPSLGMALVVASIASAARRAAPLRFRRAAIGLLVVAALLVPVYASRNERWVALAELSARTMQGVAADARGRAAGTVTLIDAPAERFNFASAFGGLLPEALQLTVGGGWTGEIVSSPDDVSRAATLVYRLDAGNVVRVR